MGAIMSKTKFSAESTPSLLFDKKYGDIHYDNPLRAAVYTPGYGVICTNRPIVINEYVQFYVRQKGPLIRGKCSLLFSEIPAAEIENGGVFKRAIQKYADCKTDLEINALTSLEYKRNGIAELKTGGKTYLKFVPYETCWLSFILYGIDITVELLGYLKSLPIPSSYLDYYGQPVDEFIPIPFNRCRCDSLVLFSADETVVARPVDRPFDDCYAYSSEPFSFLKCLAVQILDVDVNYVGSLSFILRADHLDSDCDDESKYEKRDVGKNCARNSVLYFWTDQNGYVMMRKNDEIPEPIFKLQDSRLLWPVFNIYGTTVNIRLWSCIKVQQQGAQPYTPKYVPVTECGPESIIEQSPFKDESFYNELYSNIPIASNHTHFREVNETNANAEHELGESIDNTLHTEQNDLLLDEIMSRTFDQESENEYYPAMSFIIPPNMNPTTTSDSGTCKICYDRSIKAALYPCGHMFLCMQCALELWNGNCPICRMKITDVVHVFKE